MVIAILPFMLFSDGNLFGNEQEGYVVGFFNGVKTTQIKAIESMSAIQNLMVKENIIASTTPTMGKYNVLYQNVYKNEPVYFHSFDNPTEGYFRDFEEVFVQRANEVDPSGELAQRFELLWELMESGGGPTWDLLISAFPGGRSFQEALREEELVILQRTVATIEKTDGIYEQHISELNSFIDNKQKLLFIAHSQGNLFANHAFESHLSKTA